MKPGDVRYEFICGHYHIYPKGFQPTGATRYRCTEPGCTSPIKERYKICYFCRNEFALGPRLATSKFCVEECKQQWREMHRKRYLSEDHVTEKQMQINFDAIFDSRKW